MGRTPRSAILCLAVAILMLCLDSSGSAQPSVPGSRTPLTVIAIGNAGESGSNLRGNSTYLSEMYTGRHDAGQYQAMSFLGDNFTPTGLNIPASSVEGEIASFLRPFQVPMDGLGRAREHALPGEHDYYSRNALESSVFFGLIKHQEGPSGMSSKGNERAAQIPGWTFHYGM